MTAFAGMKVIDLSGGVAGPSCAMIWPGTAPM
jgi:hypothetical protein